MTAPNVSPLTICFWTINENINTNIVIVATTVPISFQKVSLIFTGLGTATGKVLETFAVSTSAYKRTGPYEDFTLSEDFWVELDEARFHLFNKKDGNRLD